ncbi:MAG: phosphatidylinositol kinase [Deltaproteobacteria bacterium RIFCSPLOWO2_01_44_7]|nr:MAG: phosphatidylinositol kinase [Deltaproteobacteria bacterium RIFCSPHIGHO2_01_FULL_43_49]OGQ15997.1 MAG: phosphatidylinositol kinase [Deltaproteobacteria bacterium RIFCSPHIGHO2_02_FULL_44_53]OGQ28954.1 MAG: phosphatidylinositol kinase [Deltaproteobacteria bacterium RIFCSPHIGHO2_12_FULL_44_21]OGQ33175.1 MAG: phosphatidylinositol kinase [Deltaproteobacteria bacterium RIFCSPLOWO2_01_FULL_45_74]OGQ41629.1 MAG: phosphatidylinositol kinase [Deltaproteobacteria bacterium RIFCSPLOWO2_01_44_7]OGQ4
MRHAKIYYGDTFAGTLTEDADGYHFEYDNDYLIFDNRVAISLTLPLQKGPYHSKILFPFFDGLIPEGWLLDVTAEVWKINPRDRMGLLLVSCRDCIGAVRVERVNE